MNWVEQMQFTIGMWWIVLHHGHKKYFTANLPFALTQKVSAGIGPSSHKSHSRSNTDQLSATNAWHLQNHYREKESLWPHNKPLYRMEEGVQEATGNQTG